MSGFIRIFRNLYEENPELLADPSGEIFGSYAPFGGPAVEKWPDRKSVRCRATVFPAVWNRGSWEETFSRAQELLHVERVKRFSGERVLDARGERA
jgi:hypothetical protein